MADSSTYLSEASSRIPSKKTTFLLAIAFAVIACVYLVRTLYRARKHIAELKKAGLVSRSQLDITHRPPRIFTDRKVQPVAPEWSWLAGNLIFIGKVFELIPRKAHKTLMFSEIVRRHFPNEGCCYLDLWPFSYPFLMVMNPSLATQATQTSQHIACERPPRLDDFFKPLAGGPNLFDLPEKDWKPWRAIFNKGFSESNVTALVPGMVEEAVKYRDALAKIADRGELIQLDPITLRYTIDFIGRTTLNVSLGAMTGYNVLADSMLSQTNWQMPNREINPLEFLNIPRYYMQWRNSRRMNKYIGEELDRRFADYKQNRAKPSSKSVIDLVLQTYMAELPTDDKSGKAARLDPRFREFAVTQVRLFLFVGHDSMSSTICYAVHLLSTNPETLATVRREHDSVLGTNVSNAPDILQTQPQLLNSLPYTTAVIKETLRMFPPGSGIRQGIAGPAGELVAEDGTRYPTANTLIWILHTAMHRAPEYWVDPDSFLPERWLATDPADRLYPRRGAWRPFEWGPRNCIGQGLAMAELRIALAMIVREFDFEPGYDEWDRLHPPRGRGIGNGDRVTTYRGERAYQIEEAAAHPADRYPCRIHWAGMSGGDKGQTIQHAGKENGHT